MTAKELLITCRREKKELLILAERREQLATSLLPKAMRIKPVSVQESAEQDPMAKRMAAAVDLDREIDKRMGEMLMHEAEAHRIVKKIKDPRYRQLLTLYYLSFQNTQGKRLYTWEKVAEKMGYSQQRLFEMIPEAYYALEKVQRKSE